MSELAYALVGGTALLIVTLLLSAMAGWLGAGTADTASGSMTGVAAYGEQFAGLFLAGALGTFIAREFAVKPR